MASYDVSSVMYATLTHGAVFEMEYEHAYGAVTGTPAPRWALYVTGASGDGGANPAAGAVAAAALQGEAGGRVFQSLSLHLAPQHL